MNMQGQFWYQIWETEIIERASFKKFSWKLDFLEK